MQTETRKQDCGGKIAVVLDAKKLALQCQRLETDLNAERDRSVKKDERISQLTGELEKSSRYAERGLREIEQRKQESLARLRAVVHFTGDGERLQNVERMLSGDGLDPDEIATIHRKITAEFQTLYPTRPLSRAALEPPMQDAVSVDLSQYRIRNA